MSSDRLEALMNQAEVLMQARRYKEALTILQELRQQKPNKYSLTLAYTNALAGHLNNLASARKFIEIVDILKDSLVRNSPGFHKKKTILSQYIKALRTTNHYQKLLSLFLDTWLQLDLQNCDVLDTYLKDILKAGKEDRDKAFEVYECWSQIEPENFNLLYSYAIGLIDTGKYERACEVFERSLQLQPDNSITISRYARVLASTGQTEKAIQSFERSLQLEPNDPITLSRYAAALTSTGQTEKAIQSFERSLQLEPNDPITLSRYARVLASTGQTEKAIQSFERLLQVEPNNPITLSHYARVLASTGQTEEAIQNFERLLQLEPNNPITLSHYAVALTSTGQTEKAIQSFERLLQFEPNDPITLSQYAGVLASTGQTEKAIQSFERLLQFEPNNPITLSRYAGVLALAGQTEKALQIFERSLRIDPDNIITSSRYISILLKAERYTRAIEISEHLLSIESNNITALIRYGKALVGAGLDLQGLEVYQRLMLLEPNNAYVLGHYGILLVNLDNYEKACSVFSHCLQICPDSYISFQYARALEKIDKYQEAIDQLESINLNWLTSYQANVIRISLGRLYYRTNQLEKGNEYFEAAIAHSDDKERTLLYSARSILASNPYSETAIGMLQQIAEDSPRYAQALEMLTLNLNEEDYFEMVKTDSQSGLSDTEMLNRAMYHKIANEISILKGIAYRILRRSEWEDPLLSGIIQDIEEVFSEVDRRRSAQKSEIETISHNDYDSILAVISKTAHDISDFVNNQLAVIESKTRRAMQKLQSGDTHYVQFKKLLTQLELTQTALNDLKAINEGIRIKYRRFKVRKLFEKWESEPQIAQAQIVLDIQNANSEFNGDEEKIKSALNELVENSLKHNSSQKNLTIRITSQDVMNPPGIWGRTIPGEQKYLFIEFADNGNGVSGDKKDWIFQPLKTTSQEDKGSGLGLFIIRKTLTKMNGYIRETGSNGARFEIYIPYSKVEA
jgi:tetratricopeptide (TPR) repeat protein